jgi:hypothetical protein
MTELGEHAAAGATVEDVSTELSGRERTARTLRHKAVKVVELSTRVV